jgi:hypothetical protein
MTYQSRRCHETSAEREARLRLQAKDGYKPAFSKYDEEVGINDMHCSIDATRDRGDPPMMYPSYFSDQVIAHPFLASFKIVNCDKYDRNMDLLVWIEDYILAIHMANGDDLHAIKYLPLMVKGSAWHWLHTLCPGSINTWAAMQSEFMEIYEVHTLSLRMLMIWPS